MTDARGAAPGAKLILGPFGICPPTVSEDSAVRKRALVLLLGRSPQLNLPGVPGECVMSNEVLAQS